MQYTKMLIICITDKELLFDTLLCFLHIIMQNIKFLLKITRR